MPWRNGLRKQQGQYQALPRNFVGQLVKNILKPFTSGISIVKSRSFVTPNFTATSTSKQLFLSLTLLYISFLCVVLSPCITRKNLESMNTYIKSSRFLRFFTMDLQVHIITKGNISSNVYIPTT